MPPGSPGHLQHEVARIRHEGVQPLGGVFSAEEPMGAHEVAPHSDRAGDGVAVACHNGVDAGLQVGVAIDLKLEGPQRLQAADGLLQGSKGAERFREGDALGAQVGLGVLDEGDKIGHGCGVRFHGGEQKRQLRGGLRAQLARRFQEQGAIGRQGAGGGDERERPTGDLLHMVAGDQCPAFVHSSGRGATEVAPYGLNLHGRPLCSSLLHRGGS